MGTHWNFIIKVISENTHKVYFLWRNKKKIFDSPVIESYIQYGIEQYVFGLQA